MTKRIIFIVALLCIALPVVAQPSAAPAAGEAAGWDYPTFDLQAAWAIVNNAVSGLVLAAFGGAPVTLTVVALLKRVPQLDRYGAGTLTTAVAGVLYIGSIVASTFGVEVQFNSLLEFIAVGAPALVSFLATLFGAPALYEIAKARNVPLVGSSRSYIKTGGR